MGPEDAVRYAIIEQRLRGVGSYPHGAHYAIAVDDPGASFIEGRPQAGAKDPSKALLAALRDHGVDARGYFASGGERPWTLLTVGPVRRVGKDTFEAHGKYYCGLLCAGSNLYQVRVDRGVGQVTGIKTGVVS